MDIDPEIIDLLLHKDKEPKGKIVAEQIEWQGQPLVREDSLSNVVEYEGKRYVKRTKLIQRYQIITQLYELDT